MALTCNPSYLGGWDREDHGLRPAWANSSRDHVSKITTAKWTGGAAQVIEHLFASTKSWVQTLVPAQNKTKPDSHANQAWVAHTCDLSNQKVEAAGSQVQVLYSKTLSHTWKMIIIPVSILGYPTVGFLCIFLTVMTFSIFPCAHCPSVSLLWSCADGFNWAVFLLLSCIHPECWIISRDMICKSFLPFSGLSLAFLVVSFDK
jgi:hypothetical protein